MAKVFADSNNIPQTIASEFPAPRLSKEDLENLYKVLDTLTKALGDVKDRVGPRLEDEKEKQPERDRSKETWIQRWSDNQLRDMCGKNCLYRRN